MRLEPTAFSTPDFTRCRRSRLACLMVCALLVCALVALSASLVGCSDPWSERTIDDESSDEEAVQCEGTSTFVSADRSYGQRTPENISPEDNPAPDVVQRLGPHFGLTMHELVQGGGLLVKMHARRGLQLLDLTGESGPVLVGEARLGLASGTEVIGLHVVDERAYVTIDDWYSYEDSASDGWFPQPSKSGVVLTVDIEDPSRPQVVGRTLVAGKIRASELARSDGPGRLVVVGDDEQGTFIRSFGLVPSGELPLVDEVHMNERVSDVRLTPDRVVTADYESVPVNGGIEGFEPRVEVTVVDIASGDGRLIRGDSVVLAGPLARTNYGGLMHAMSFDGDVLRVVYSGVDTYIRVEVVETIDASDIHDLKLIDRVKVAEWPVEEGDVLFFGPNVIVKSFWQGTTSIHRLMVDASGQISEAPGFEASHRLQYAHVFDEARRLLGYGGSEEELVVSLHDVLDVGQGEPLITQKRFVPAGRWADYRWNTDAATVLEDATSARSSSGEVEPHLLVVPLLEYEAYMPVRSALQVFSFSENSITRRGVIDDRSSTLHSFVASQDVIGNMSAHEVSLFDLANPDEPEEVGRVPIAPSYKSAQQLNAVDGGLSVWRRQPTMGSESAMSAPDEAEDVVEVYRRGDDPATSPALAQFEILAASDLFQVGDLLVNVYQLEDHWFTCGPERERAKTHIKVWDLSEPTSPQLRSDFVTEAIDQGTYRYNDDGELCARGAADVRAVGDTLVFQSEHVHSEQGDEDWHHFEFQVLDLRDPDAPHISARVNLPAAERGLSVLARGDSLFVTHYEPVEHASEARPYRRYYFRQIDLSEPAKPAVGPSINIPGELLEVDGDMLVTEDYQWGEVIADPVIRKLELGDARACLRGSKRYEGQDLNSVQFDEAGKIFVYQQENYYVAQERDSYSYPREEAMSVLDLESDGLDELAKFELAGPGRRGVAHRGRLFVESECLVVVNFEDPSAPFTEACLPSSLDHRLWSIGGELHVAGVEGLDRLSDHWLHLLP